MEAKEAGWRVCATSTLSMSIVAVLCVIRLGLTGEQSLFLPLRWLHTATWTSFWFTDRRYVFKQMVVSERPGSCRQTWLVLASLVNCLPSA